MMDPGDANFSLPSSNFILLPSQDETQEESLEEDEMRRILTTLPALQVMYEPRHQKTCLQGLGPGKTQTGLLSYRS